MGKFSVEKNNMVIFTRKRNLPDISLRLYGRVLQRVSVFRFLGVLFDSKLTWGEHITKIMGKCQKVLNVMRCLSGTTWGAGFMALKTIYVTMIRSVVNYGSVTYISASKSQLEK